MCKLHVYIFGNRFENGFGVLWLIIKVWVEILQGEKMKDCSRPHLGSGEVTWGRFLRPREALVLAATLPNSQIAAGLSLYGGLGFLYRLKCGPALAHLSGTRAAQGRSSSAALATSWCLVKAVGRLSSGAAV